MSTELLIYLAIGILTFFIGYFSGHISIQGYYRRKFREVAEACEKEDSIVPLIIELERES